VAILQPKKNHWRSLNADLMPGVLEEDQEAALEVYRDSLVPFVLLGKVGLESNVLSVARQM